MRCAGSSGEEADCDSECMTDETRVHDGSSGESTESTASGLADQGACHETVDRELRAAVLSEYGHRCQACGRRGPEKGGLASLHVHHIEREPEGMDVHDWENLTVLCRSCHSWLHQQSSPADAPVEITEEDRAVLLPQDIEILQVLAERGPMRTGSIAAALTADLTVSAVRERLWVLMGLDTRVETRDEQIVDKDVETGEWGLTEQIETSARGHIPDDQQLLLQRMEDEQVRRALERGCDRSDVTAVLGISRRTTFNKTKRAYAYDFPLEAFSRGGRSAGGETRKQSGAECSSDAEVKDGQQRLDTVDDDGDADLVFRKIDGSAVMAEEMSGDDDGWSQKSDMDEVHRKLRAAIEALNEIDASL